jgi:hypothetical protein
MEESTFNHLSEQDKINEIFKMGKKTYEMVKAHDPVIERMLKYEQAGVKTGKYFMRIFVGGLIAGITIWITNHFGK